MLYLTTRDPHDTFTAHKALTEQVADNGGLFIPLKFPFYDADALKVLLDKDFCDIVAEILNHFFSLRISPWAVEVCIGRNPVKIATPGRKVLIAESWYNPGRNYEYLITQLNGVLSGIHETIPKSWLRVAVGIAFAFAVFSLVGKSGYNETMDVCVHDGDLSMPTAMLYAKQMGLPINKIIICSKENSAIWDLINHGQLVTSLLGPEQKLAAERIVCSMLGQEQNGKYVAACQRRGVFTVELEQEQILPETLFASVIGEERIRSVQKNVFHTNGYSLSDDAALCYGGVQDYRSKTGQGTLTLLFGLEAPEN